MRASLVVQWLKICLPMQVMGVQSLVRELRSHMQQGKKACELQVLCWSTLEPEICNKRSLGAATREMPPCTTVKTQCSSITQSCPTLCSHVDCSTPGFSVHHQLPELTQTHVHRVGDVIQPSHPLSSSSPSAFNLSLHQGFFPRS